MNTNIKVTLTPADYVRPPTGRISVGQDICEFVLEKTLTFEFDLDLPQDSKITLIVEHYGKTNKDTYENKDTAIIVEKIQLNNIESQKFVWAGVYRPSYPEDYPNKIFELSPHTYLGWNGIWTLELTVPIFTWIHKIEDLGWIYN